MSAHSWWKSVEVNLVAVFLDGPAIAALACCREIQMNLRSKQTLRWLTDLRGFDPDRIATLEQLELAEAMSELSSSIFFGWGSFDVEAVSTPSLARIADLLSRHSSLVLMIEAHCGLEARFHMPLPGDARRFTKGRAQVVYSALAEVALRIGKPLEDGRVLTRAWGCSRPLEWAFRPGYFGPGDAEASARNRRVELYLRSNDFEAPRRRRRSEIPLPPGLPPLEDRLEEEGPEAAEAAQDAALASSPEFIVFPVQNSASQTMVVPRALLRQPVHQVIDVDASSEEEMLIPE